MALQAIFCRAFDSDRAVPFVAPRELAAQPLRDRRARLAEIQEQQQYHRPAIETLMATAETIEINRAKMGGVLVLDDHGCPVQPRRYGLRSRNMQSERQMVLEEKIKCAAGFSRIDTTLADIKRELIIADMALRYESINNEWIDDMVIYPIGRCRALIDKIQSRLCKAPYPFETTSPNCISASIPTCVRSPITLNSTWQLCRKRKSSRPMTTSNCSLPTRSLPLTAWLSHIVRCQSTAIANRYQPACGRSTYPVFVRPRHPCATETQYHGQPQTPMPQAGVTTIRIATVTAFLRR